MPVYVQSEDMPLVLEFLGRAEVDEVSAALELALRRKFVLTVELRDERADQQRDVMVNFGAVTNLTVRASDPRADEGWDNRLVYSVALPELLDSMGPDDD